MPFIVTCNPCYASTGKINSDVVSIETATEGSPYLVGEYLCSEHVKLAIKPWRPRKESSCMEL